jgi:multiple sugar transport system permease protein
MGFPPTRIPAGGSAPSPAGRRRRWEDAGLAYLLLAPSALILGVFGFMPLLNAFLLSLREWKLVPGGFVGLQNYRQALAAEPDFWQSLGVTLYYVIGTVPLTLILGYFLAELLHARIRGLALYRTLFFMPYIVSPVAAAAVWRWILHPNFGLATAVAGRFGAQPRWLYEAAGIFQLIGQGRHVAVPDWAAGPSLALVCIIGVTIWHSLGFAVVVLLAGLSAVPGEVIEAARLDGARGWSLIRHVKLPLLSPTLFFLLVVFTVRAFQTFTQLYVLSIDNAGGPNGTTRNITLYIVQSFHDNAPRLGPGYGSAVAMLLFLVILALTLVQFRVLGRRVHYA